MDVPVSPARLQVACSGCAMQPLCEATGPIPCGTPAVDRRHRLQGGQPLFHAGAPQASLYAVRAGFLKATAPVGGSGEHIVRFLLPGDAAGLEGFGPRRHALTAIALEDSEVCEIPLRRARTLADSFPAVASHLRRLLAHELALAEARSAGIAHLPARLLVSSFLLDLATRWGERGYSATTFRLPMHRWEIADCLGLTVETVSRQLSEFRARRWATVTGRQVEIHDTAALRSLNASGR